MKTISDVNRGYNLEQFLIQIIKDHETGQDYNSLHSSYCVMIRDWFLKIIERKYKLRKGDRN